MMRKAATILLVAILGFGVVSAAERWLHVRVQEAGDEQVSVNIPLELVEAILPTIRTDELRDGRIHWRHHADLEEIDLRGMLEALRDAPDAEFVTVRGRDESVRVAKERGFLLVHVDDAGGDRVRVRMPLRVVEAMLASGEAELDLVAALRALAEFDGEDLVTIQSDDGGSVRVWIDSSEIGD